MWTRAQLKDKAKIGLRGNYWKAVLVTLIVFLIGGASGNVGIKIDSSDLKGLAQSGMYFEMGFFQQLFLILPVIIGTAIIIGTVLSIFIHQFTTF